MCTNAFKNHLIRERMHVHVNVFSIQGEHNTLVC